ncbi:MAG: PadR family transcriptional regulator [Pseudomonadota bacterium]
MDVKTLCLGVLSQGDASGYEIKKAFEEGPFAHIHAASFGSIYPALEALRGVGQVACRQLSQDKRPDKKLFSITEAGLAAFEKTLLSEPSPDKTRSDFLFILFFAQHLPAEKLARLLDQRIAWYRACLERMDDCAAQNGDAPPGAAFVRGMGQAVYRAAADYLEQNRAHLLGRVEKDHQSRDRDQKTIPPHASVSGAAAE